MNNLNIKYFVYILTAMSAGLCLIIAAVKGIDLRQASYQELFGMLPPVVTVDIICTTLFVKWLWKWKFFYRWLVPFPNLNGTWEGTIRSDWMNPETGEVIPPIPATIGIKQSFLNISCVVRTGEMRSDSYTGEFRIDPDRQIKQLIYTYSSNPRPKVSDRSTPHNGTVVLNIVEDTVKKLEGRYWTERKTTGEMCFKFSGKNILDELPNELPKHPLQS